MKYFLLLIVGPVLALAHMVTLVNPSGVTIREQFYDASMVYKYQLVAPTGQTVSFNAPDDIATQCNMTTLIGGVSTQIGATSAVTTSHDLSTMCTVNLGATTPTITQFSATPDFFTTSTLEMFQYGFWTVMSLGFIAFLFHLARTLGRQNHLPT